MDMFRVNENLFAFLTDNGLTLKGREKTKFWSWQNDIRWIEKNEKKGLNGFVLKFWKNKVYLKNKKVDETILQYFAFAFDKN